MGDEHDRASLGSIQIFLLSGMAFSSCLSYRLINPGQRLRQFFERFALTHFVFCKEWVAASSYQHVITTLQDKSDWAASPGGNNSISILDAS